MMREWLELSTEEILGELEIVRLIYGSWYQTLF